MTSLSIRTPSRLHFGLLGWGSHAIRQFGGVGLMVQSPGLRIEASPSDTWSATGPLADRTIEIAHKVSSWLDVHRPSLSTTFLHFHIQNAPPQHVGLGTGTQISLAIACLITEFARWPNCPLSDLAAMTGRGRRSGIGLHGFAQGGLVVDGGRGDHQTIPPLITRFEFPREWSILVVSPRRLPGLHGQDEVAAFQSLPSMPERLTDRICRLVLLGLLPSLAERDLPGFGTSLEELQTHVGRGFASAQGGLFASQEVERIALLLRSLGLHGVGQSSWGPTLYGFTDLDEKNRLRLLEELQGRNELNLASVVFTQADNQGATLYP